MATDPTTRARIARRLTARRLALRREPSGRPVSLCCGTCHGTLWRLEVLDALALRVAAVCWSCGTATPLAVPLVAP